MNATILWTSRALALAAMLVAAASQQAAERPVPREPSDLVRAAGNQFTPVTATDGNDFIAVWEGSRVESQIYMTIVRRDGEVAAPRPILVSGSLRNCRQPAVSWNGSSYLVAWAHHVYQEGWRISLVRVSADGRLLDTTPRTIITSAAFPNGSGPFIASNGHSSVVYTPVNDPSAALRVVALDKDANIVASQDDSRYGRSSQALYRVVPLGGHYALVVYAFDIIWTSAVTLTGNRLLFGDDRLVDFVDDRHSGGELLGATSDGKRALIVYNADDVAQIRLFARTITSEEIGPRVEVFRTDLVRTASGGYYIPIPSLAMTSDRSGFFLAWRSVAGEMRNPELDGPQGRDVIFRPSPTVAIYDTLVARFDSSGQLRSTSTIVAGGGFYDDVSIASNDASLFTLWNETLMRYPVVYKIAAGLWRFQSDLSRVEIAFSRPEQGSPRIAAGTDGYLVVWREEPQNDGFGVIMAQRRDRDGRVRELPRKLSDASGNQLAPRVAFNGREYLVAWIDSSPGRQTIVGRGMAADGRMLDAGPALITESFFGGAFALASNGADFAVAYTAPYPNESSVVRVARMSSPVTSVTTQSIRAGDAVIDTEVEIAAGGGDYLVGWSTGKWPTARGAVATASLSSGGPAQRLESFWFSTPVMACVDASCVALAYRTPGSQKLTPLTFWPSAIPASSHQAELSWRDGLRLISRGDEFLVAGKVSDGGGSSLRAQYLSQDGAAASDEIRVLEQLLIGEFDVAMSDDGLAVVYVAPNRVDVAPRIFVKTVKR